MSPNGLRVIRNGSPSVPTVACFTFKVPAPRFRDRLCKQVAGVVRRAYRRRGVSITDMKVRVRGRFAGVPGGGHFSSHGPRGGSYTAEGRG